MPRVIKASIIINFQKSGDLTASQWTKLRTLTKQGIAENWSRTGARAVRLINNLVRKTGGLSLLCSKLAPQPLCPPACVLSIHHKFPPPQQPINSPVSTCRCMM